MPFKRGWSKSEILKHITENGTIVLKFFLHISKESRERLLRRKKNTIGSSQWGFERKMG
jgi:polyphosphate kinase 2 (PPK2 family)